MTQERRRYGFVLERQCSLAKHWIAYHTSGKNCISSHVESWDEVSASREFLPPNVDNMFAKSYKVTSGVDSFMADNILMFLNFAAKKRDNIWMMNLIVAQCYQQCEKQKVSMLRVWICVHWAM